MKKITTLLGLALSITLLTTSCTSVNKALPGANVRVELEKNDFEFSNQVKGEATSKKILGIDFQRLTEKKTGEIDQPGAAGILNLTNIPVIGSILTDKTANLALYDIMNENKGYDVVFYPQYETIVNRPFLGLGFIYKTTTVKATARLARIKK